MSASQMTHMLKVIGKGSMETGILVVFGSGILTGAVGTIVIGAAVYGTYKLGCWAYQRFHQHLIDQVCIQ